MASGVIKKKMEMKSLETISFNVAANSYTDVTFTLPPNSFLCGYTTGRIVSNNVAILAFTKTTDTDGLFRIKNNGSSAVTGGTVLVSYMLY